MQSKERTSTQRSQKKGQAQYVVKRKDKCNLQQKAACSRCQREGGAGWGSRCALCTTDNTVHSYPSQCMNSPEMYCTVQWQLLYSAIGEGGGRKAATAQSPAHEGGRVMYCLHDAGHYNNRGKSTIHIIMTHCTVLHWAMLEAHLYG